MYNHPGMLRNQDQDKPADTSGEIILSGDPALGGPGEDPIEMIQKPANSGRIKQVFVRHAFRFRVGRNETINDAPILQAACHVCLDNNGSMKVLRSSLLTFDAFLYRHVSGRSPRHPAIFPL